MVEPCDTFPVSLDVVIRPCREDDLPALEWFGLFAEHRPLILRVFEQHRRGEALMLVVEANGEASGQLWAGTEHCDGEQAGVIWALRVMPCLQRLGIGARLLTAAESLLLARGCSRVEVNVETDHVAARRFYERLGYRFAATGVAGRLPGSPDADGRIQWVLAKQLRRNPPARPGRAR